MNLNPARVPVPKNGAVLVRSTSVLDLVKRLTDGVQHAARTQEMAGDDVDDAELSTIVGTYDWRAYVREELRATRGGFHS